MNELRFEILFQLRDATVIFLAVGQSRAYLSS